MKYGCIGEHMKHSFSKEIHNALADYQYEIKEIPREEIDLFFKNREFSAINVTIPYKETVIPHLYFIDEHAKKIGAINTVVNKDGKLYGYNTDFYGMLKLIEYAKIDLKGKKVAILGAGGTSKTAKAVAEFLGAIEILTISISEKPGCISYEQLYLEHADTEIIINTSPCGMYPKVYDIPLDISKFKKLSGVVDAVYNPLKTQLVLAAEKENIKAIGGLYMLVAQAVRASEIFLDTKYSDDVIDTVFSKLKSQKENIALIGMPSSGKSTVGALLSKKLNREFIDTDTLIAQKVGTSVAEFIDKNGIESFRKLESETVEEIAGRNALVIATGGGVPLCESNVQALKLNSKIYFIDRPLSELTPTKDRPLSRTKDAVEKLYNERHGIYEKSADVIINADCDANGVADKIEEDFTK